MSEVKIESPSFAFYNQLMQQTRTSKDLPSDCICYDCKYHESDWTYRFCRFTKCPYIAGFQTYRDEFYDEGRTNGGISG